MSIYIEPYTAKSFVVRGDTKSKKEEIEKIGGLFNNRLTDKKTGERFSAYIFSNTKKDFVEKWLNTGEIDESLVVKYNNYSSSYSNDNNKASSTNSINIKLIMERLKKLEDEVKYLRSKLETDGEESEYEEIVVETDEEDEEEEPVKLRKLL